MEALNYLSHGSNKGYSLFSWRSCERHEIIIFKSASRTRVDPIILIVGT